MRILNPLAIALSLLSTVAFSASPTVEDSPVSPLGIRTVIPGDKAKLQLPLYLEPPSTNDVLRCVKKQGGCLAVVPTSGGAILRKYAKPKFSKTQFVFEDNPLSSDSRAEEAWRGYQTLRDMLLSAKCFEMDYGAEIAESAGDRYQALTNAVKSLAQAYNGNLFDKNQYAEEFAAIKKVVREKSVAEQSRNGLRAVNAFRATHAKDYTLPDEETKAILEILDAIRTKGSNGAPDAAKALAARQKAYAVAVLVAVRKEREAHIAVLAESHVPFELLFASSDVAKDPLAGFPVEINDDSEAALAAVDERIAAAEAELVEGRKRHQSVLGRMASLEKSKFGPERVFEIGGKKKVASILNGHKDGEKYLTEGEAKDVEAILTKAEETQQQMVQLDADAREWIAQARSRLALLGNYGNDASLRQSGLDTKLLFPDGSDKDIVFAINIVADNTIDFFQKEKDGVEQKLSVSEALLEKAKSTIHWVEGVKGHLENLTASKYPETEIFLKTKPAEISQQLSGIYKAPLEDWNNAMSQINVDMKNAQDRFSVLSTIDRLLAQSTLSYSLVSEVRNNASNKEIMSELANRHSNRYIRYLALSSLGTPSEILQDFVKEQSELIIAGTAKSESLSLKGFQLGMDIGDAYILCKYHFPDRNIDLSFENYGTSVNLSVMLQTFAKTSGETKISSYSIPPNLLESLLPRVSVSSVEDELGISLRKKNLEFEENGTRIAVQSVFCFSSSRKGSVQLYGDFEADEWELKRLKRALESINESAEDITSDIANLEKEHESAANAYAWRGGGSWDGLLDLNTGYDRAKERLRDEKAKLSKKAEKITKTLVSYDEFKRNAKPAGYLILGRGE